MTPLELLEQRLSGYTDEETKKRLDSYEDCGPSLEEWLDYLNCEIEQRTRNLILYGNSWSDAELEMIKEKNGGL
jgi:hypothetical protein